MTGFCNKLFDLKYIDRPYNDFWEYYRDFTKLTNLKLLFILANEQQPDEDDNTGYDMFESVDSFLKLLMKDSILFESRSIPEQYMDDITQCEQYVKSRRLISCNAGIFLPDVYLSGVFSLNSFEHDCLMLSLIAGLDAKYEKIFSFINDSSARKYPTVETALKLFTDKDSKAHENLKYLVPDSTLMKFFFKLKARMALPCYLIR